LRPLSCAPALSRPATSFDPFVKKLALGQTKFIAYCPTNSTQNLIQLIPSEPHHKSVLLVGPEGDFTLDEVRQASALGFVSVSLGQNRLRTETAGLYVCQAVSILSAIEELK